MSGPIDNDVSGDTPSVAGPSWQAGSVTVTTSATLICVVPAGLGVTVYSSAAVHLGDSGVTSSTGFALPATTVLPLPGGKDGARALYGVVASSTATVSYIFAADD